MPALSEVDLLLAALLGAPGDAPSSLLRAACARLVSAPNHALAEVVAARTDVPLDALADAYDAAAHCGEGLVPLALAVARTVRSTHAQEFVEVVHAHARTHGDHEELAAQMVSADSVPDAVRRAWCSMKSVSILTAIMEVAPTSAASQLAVRTYLSLPDGRRTLGSDETVAGGLWALVAMGKAPWLREIQDGDLLGWVIIHACRGATASAARVRALMRDPVMAPLWAERAVLPAIECDIVEADAPWFTQMLMEDRVIVEAVLARASVPVRAQLVDRLTALLGNALSSRQRTEVQGIIATLTALPDPDRGAVLGEVGDPDVAAALLTLMGDVDVEQWPKALTVLASLSRDTTLQGAVTSTRAVLA